MLRACILFTCCLCLKLIVNGQSRDSILLNDHLQLRNGTVVLGKLQEIERAKVYLDAKNISDVSADLEQVAHLRATSSLFRIVLLDGRKYVGRIIRHDSPGMVYIKLGDHLDSVSIVGIYSALPVSKNFWQGLDGHISFGYSFTKSSEINRVNFSNTLNFNTELWNFRQQASAIFTFGEADRPLERADLSFSGNWLFSRRWIQLNKVQYQRQLETGILSRYILASGAGRRLLQTQNINLLAGTGLSIQKEFATDGSQRNIQLEVPLMTSLNIYQLKKPDIDIVSDFSFYINLSQAGRYRIDHKTVMSYEIIKDFKVSLDFFFNYDSRPPGILAKSYDYGTVVSFGYSF